MASNEKDVNFNLMENTETGFFSLKNKKFLIICGAALLVVIILIIIIVVATSKPKKKKEPKIIYKDVNTTSQFIAALSNAEPGMNIRLASGTYDFANIGDREFSLKASGTKEKPITITVLDSKKKPILKGSKTSSGICLHITGSYWIIENLIIHTAENGIYMQNASYNTIKNCEIYNIGLQAIAIKRSSTYNLITNCDIHDTGVHEKGEGEGVIIGSPKLSSTSDYSDYNAIRNCTFVNVTAEHVDIREYTTGNEVGYCTFNGDGISGEDDANSFVNIAGKLANIHDNTGYRNKNKYIEIAFEMDNQVYGWAINGTFTGNTLYMDRPYGEINTTRRTFIVDGWESSVLVKENYVDQGSGLQEANSTIYFYYCKTIYTLR